MELGGRERHSPPRHANAQGVRLVLAHPRRGPAAARSARHLQHARTQAAAASGEDAERAPADEDRERVEGDSGHDEGERRALRAPRAPPDSAI